jgi:hypothetical protein
MPSSIRSRRSHSAVAMKQQTKAKAKTKNVTFTESCVLMKNLLRTSIATIAYLRNLFDADNFRSKKLDGKNTFFTGLF